MGFFSNLLGGAKELTKISNGAANIFNLLEQYEIDPDLTFIYVSAWIARVSILDVVEKNNFPSSYSLFVPIHGHQTKVTIGEVYAMTITKILSKANERGPRTEQFVQDIIDKEDAFYDIDNQLPSEQKALFI